MRRAGPWRTILTAALLASSAGACAKQVRCRPGTVFLHIDLSTFGGRVARVQVETRMDGAGPWSSDDVANLSGSGVASVELAFKSGYPTGSELEARVTAFDGANQPVGSTMRATTLEPGCTVLEVGLSYSDGGAGGAAGTGGTAGTGRGGSGGATGGGGNGDVSACKGVPRSEWANWPMPNPRGSGLPNERDYASMTVGAQTVVCDRVTKLMWQQDNTGNYPAKNREDASTNCEALIWAGFDDWRLPTHIELFSIVDFTKPIGQPLIDAAAFPATPADDFWTYTQFGALPFYWSIDFGSGQTTNGLADQSGPIFRVRCVR